MSEPRSAPTVGQVVLGKRLQDLRERVGLTRDQAAKVLRVAPATIRRMETAEVGLKIPYVQLLLKAYGIADDEAEAFVDLAEEANKPGWWQRFHDVLPDWFSMYVSLEGAASLLRMYEPHFVPGLLQTEDYARSVMRTGAVGQTRPEDIERHVALRMERQSLLAKEDAPRLWVIMDETVLRRPVGGPQVMRAQIDKLLEATELPHVTLQDRGIRERPPPGHLRAVRPLPVRRTRTSGHGLQRVPHRSGLLRRPARGRLVPRSHGPHGGSGRNCTTHEGNPPGLPQGAVMNHIYNGMPAADLGSEGWYKPWSGGNGGNCIEAMKLADGRVAVRQSADPDGPALIYSNGEIAAFIQGAKAGQADFLLT
ncbi:hypothetical protein SCYAM73S_08241 [Streptomyces cyaneofuscatus]